MQCPRCRRIIRDQRRIAMLRVRSMWRFFERILPVLTIAALAPTVDTAMGQEPGIVRPDPAVLREIITGMPRGERQEVRVLTATFKPGDKTVFHTHRFPVTVYILEGVFTLEMEGRAPVTIKAGQAMVEPVNVKMTGHNRSATDSLRVVIFYVSDPETPFLDPIQ
jgi:quercetin dioxygenase-like cupin family protein